ncbi:E3 ubiquitin-protein ligase Rnf220-like [Pecten maximus]|uniref:E3 ubiquitin-protein ligase Rnf220-like n=1 Tax=Pecten maximus TaxID=6579 RepID=UPI0014584805|nr:E3 ubiquitin-protein ligase Rnf220-like [Pecten maximus]XP_033737236.1 E3 ubiquitin-protein ligase Rnf220-like [Pecten maximus]
MNCSKNRKGTIFPENYYNMSSISDFAMFRFNLWHKNPFFSHHAAAVAAAQAGNPGIMENTSFVPNPLTSPALMVLASTAENHEGARMPAPPHHFQGQNVDKDMPTPFGTPPFTMYRPGEHFPPPLYTPVPPYVRANLERGMGLINPGGGSAFRPVSNPEGVENYHSAFSLAKKPKLDESSSSYASSEKLDRDSCDPTHEGPESKGSTPFVKEERPSSISSATNSENFSDGGDFDRGTPDPEGRSLRKQRRKCVLDGQTPCCPICGITLRPGEVDAHFNLELDKLNRFTRGGRRSRDTTPQGRKSLPSPSGRRGKDSPSMEVASQSRFDTYQRIKCNRQARLTSRSRTRKKKTEETVCPICNERLSGTPEELNGHVEMCLKKRNEIEDEPVDVEGDGDTYEEYTWAGQTRIRATTMLQGGFSGTGFQVMNLKKSMEEDIDLNVDGDDSEQYGTAQFNEGDILPCRSDEPSEDLERKALRGAVLRNISPGDPSTSQCNVSSAHETMEMEGNISSSPGSSPTHPNSMDIEGSAAEVIEALKARLKSKETTKKEIPKCLICMESYNKPLTSIQCWHVHCEGCWLHTLGAKKLCPQCNMITAPGDLRRIYL